MLGLYDETVDRESAYEVLKKRASDMAEREEQQQQAEQRQDGGEPSAGARRTASGFELPDFGSSRGSRRSAPPPRQPSRRTTSSSSRRQSTGEALVKSVVRTVGSQLGRALVRGILGSIKKGF